MWILILASVMGCFLAVPVLMWCCLGKRPADESSTPNAQNSNDEYGRLELVSAHARAGLLEAGGEYAAAPANLKVRRVSSRRRMGGQGARLQEAGGEYSPVPLKLKGSVPMEEAGGEYSPVPSKLTEAGGEYAPAPVNLKIRKVSSRRRTGGASSTTSATATASVVGDLEEAGGAYTPVPSGLCAPPPSAMEVNGEEYNAPPAELKNGTKALRKKVSSRRHHPRQLEEAGGAYTPVPANLLGEKQLGAPPPRPTSKSTKKVRDSAFKLDTLDAKILQQYGNTSEARNASGTPSSSMPRVGGEYDPLPVKELGNGTVSRLDTVPKKAYTRRKSTRRHLRAGGSASPSRRNKPAGATKLMEIMQDSPLR